MSSTTLYTDKDTFIVKSSPTQNSDGYGYLAARSGAVNAAARILVSFDIPGAGLSGNAIITATLSLYRSGGAGATGRNYDACKMTQDAYVENEATWNIYSTGNNWTLAGGDYVETNPTKATAVSIAVGQWHEWDVTEIVQDAVDENIFANFIIRDAAEDSGDTGSLYRDEADATYKPKLYIEYATTVDKSQSDTVASVTETISKSTQSFDYSTANNNQAYILNLKTGYWTFQDNCPFTNAIYRPLTQQIMGARRDTGQITRLDYGSTFDGIDIDSTIKTGDMNFGQLDEIQAFDAEMSEAIKKIRAIFTEVIGEGDLTLKVYSETNTSGTSFTITVSTTDNTTLNVIRTALSRSLRGKYYTFEITNNSGNDMWLGEIRIKIKSLKLK